MHGNVWEWVEDCWHDSYGGAPNDGSAWLEEDGGDCGSRILRGGSWGNGPGVLRSANRDSVGPDDRGLIVGFRIARTLR
jgi:formylglycine-generating enzyme required for sulfatase activity